MLCHGSRMFLKRCLRQKDGKIHTYWALVESIRTARGPRHRVVAWLGELGADTRQGWARMAHGLGNGGQLAEQENLFPSGEAVSCPEWIRVNIERIRIERSREFGNVWLAWVLWKKLGLDVLFQKLLGEEKQEETRRPDIPWSIMAFVLTAARLCEPSSELHIEDTWYHKTALSDFLGISDEKINTDRLYRAMDQILPHKGALEGHLKSRLGELFSLSFDLLLYDVTSTFFEGEAKKNPKARRGYSRDHRSDCKQVCIGLVVTPEGIPFGYEVFAGNRHDATTLEEIVGAMEAKYGKANRIWVMDRGIVSEENLAFLRSRGGQYIVGTPKGMLRRFEKELPGRKWTEVAPQVKVKLCRGPQGSETFILCRSEARREKERAMHRLFAGRIEKGLTELSKAMRKGSLTDAAVAERRIGRLLQANQRAARLFDIRVIRKKKGLTLQWKRQTKWFRWAGLSDGCYLLRTNLNEWDPQKLWKAYIQLTAAEAAFRAMKSELNVRPVFHQREYRVDAHILVCFLAYVLWKTFEKWMSRCGLGDAPRTVLEEMQRIRSVDVVLPTSSHKEIRLRCVESPDQGQRILLAHLGLGLPKRLSPKMIENMEFVVTTF